MVNIYSEFQTQYKKYPQFNEPKRNEQKGDEFYSKVESRIKIQGSQEFIGEIKREIKVLAGWKAGRALLKYILKNDRPEILIREGAVSQHDRQTQDIEIEMPSAHMDYYYCALNESEETILAKYPDRFFTLAHELLHQRDEKNRKGFNANSSGLINSHMSNIEEQIVITGFDTHIKPMVYYPLNESVFLTLCKLSMRINHLGLRINSGELPTMIDCITLGAFSTAKSFKDIDLNLPQKTHDCPYRAMRNKNISPLTAAYATNDRKMIDYLIAKGARPDVQDDFGGPLHAAAHYGWSSTLMTELIQKGISVDTPNPDQETPLMILIEKEKYNAFNFLLTQGPNLELTNKNGETALAVAVRLKLASYVSTLVQYGAKVPPSLQSEVEKLLEQSKHIMIF